MLLLVVILYALFGLSFTIGKLMLAHVAPFITIATRMIIGGVCLLGYSYRQNKTDWYPKKENFWLHIQHAILGVYLFYSLRAWGLQYVTTTKAALLCNLMPFFTAVFSYFMLKEKLQFHQIIGLIIGFTGTLPLLLNESSYEELVGSIGKLSWPECAILLAVAALSCSVIMMQQLVKHRECTPTLANGVSMLFGGIMALGSSLVVEDTWVREGANLQVFACLIVAQIIISNIICSNLHASLLKHYSATFMSFASFLSPLCTIIYGYFLLNETTSWYFFASFFLVITGLFIYHFDDVRKTANRKVSLT